MATTAELIRRGARQHGGRTAVLSGDERLTFAETNELASRIANVLCSRGLERVGLLVENSLWSVPLDFGCAKARIARVPLNPRLGARVAAEPPGPPDDLSERELDVLRLIAFGHTNVEIGEQLYLSVRTVETHRAHIQQKLLLNSRSELVRYALARGLIDAG